MDLNVIQTMQNFNQPKKKSLTLEARHSISIEASNKIRSKLKSRLFIPRQSITRHSIKTQHYPKEIKPTWCKYQNFTNFTSLKEFESIKKGQTDIVENVVKLFRGKYTKRTQCDKNFKTMENINKTYPKKNQNIKILKNDRDLKTDKNGKKKRKGDFLSHCKEKIGKQTYGKLSNKQTTVNAKERAVKNWNLKVIGNENTKDTTRYLTDGDIVFINTKEALHPPVLLPRDKFSSNSTNSTINSDDIFKNPSLYSFEFVNINKNCLPDLQTPDVGSKNTSRKKPCHSRNYKSKDGESSKQNAAKTSNESSNNKNCDSEKLQPKVKEISGVFIVQTSSESKEKNIASYKDSKSELNENSTKMLPNLFIKNGETSNCSNTFEGTKNFTIQLPSENVNETICASSKLPLIIGDNKRQQPVCVSTTIGSTHRNDSELNEHRPRIVNSATPVLQVSLLQQQQPVPTTIVSAHRNDSEPSGLRTSIVTSTTPQTHIALLQQQQPVLSIQKPNETTENCYGKKVKKGPEILGPNTTKSTKANNYPFESSLAAMADFQYCIRSSICQSYDCSPTDQQINEDLINLENCVESFEKFVLQNYNDIDSMDLKTKNCVDYIKKKDENRRKLDQQSRSPLSTQSFACKTTDFNRFNNGSSETFNNNTEINSNFTKSTNDLKSKNLECTKGSNVKLSNKDGNSINLAVEQREIENRNQNLMVRANSNEKLLMERGKVAPKILKVSALNSSVSSNQSLSNRHSDSGKTHLQSTPTNPYNLIYTQAQSHNSLLPPIRCRLQEPSQLCNSIVSQAPNRSPLIVTNNYNNSLATATPVPGNIYLQPTEVPRSQLYPSNEMLSVQHSQMPNVIANHFETQNYDFRMPSLPNNYQSSALNANYSQSNLGSAALTSENVSVFRNYQMENLSILHANSEAMKWNFQRLEP